MSGKQQSQNSNDQAQNGQDQQNSSQERSAENCLIPDIATQEETHMQHVGTSCECVVSVHEFHDIDFGDDVSESDAQHLELVETATLLDEEDDDDDNDDDAGDAVEVNADNVNPSSHAVDVSTDTADMNSAHTMSTTIARRVATTGMQTQTPRLPPIDTSVGVPDPLAASNDEVVMRASVRNMFVQLFRRLNLQREQQKNDAQVGLQAALEAADKRRHEIISAALEYSKMSGPPSKRRRIDSSAIYPIPWVYGNDAGAFCCSGCKTPICRPQDVVLDRDNERETGPRVVLADTDVKRELDIYVRACNVRRSNMCVFVPRTQPNWSYEAATVSCPTCYRELGVRIESVAHRGPLAFSGNETYQDIADVPEASLHFRPITTATLQEENSPTEQNNDPEIRLPTTTAGTQTTSNLDNCIFPAIIRTTALYGSPRMLRISMDTFDSDPQAKTMVDVETGRLIRYKPVQRTVLCGRYLEWSHGSSLKSLEGMLYPRVLSSKPQGIVCKGKASSGEACTTTFADTNQILCAKRTWRTEDRSESNAIYMNALDAKATALSVARLERYNGGSAFMIRDVFCTSCGALVGAAYESDRSRKRNHSYKEHRFVLFTDAIQLKEVEVAAPL